MYFLIPSIRPTFSGIVGGAGVVKNQPYFYRSACISKNRGTSKWMVYNLMENPIQMDDLGVPLFLETPIWLECFFACE